MSAGEGKVVRRAGGGIAASSVVLIAALGVAVVALWIWRPYSTTGTVGATIGFLAAIVGLAAIADPGSAVERSLVGYQRGADRFSDGFGWLSKWLVPICVIIGFFNVLLRYIGRFTQSALASTAYIDLQWMIFGAIFMLGFPYVLKHGVNVRVDFVFQHYPRKVKALIDFGGHLISLVPYTLLAVWVQWAEANRSVFNDCSPRGNRCTWKVWEVWQRSGDAGGLARAPIKVLLLVGFVLLLMQTIAELIKLGFVLGEREDIAAPEVHEEPLRIE